MGCNSHFLRGGQLVDEEELQIQGGFLKKHEERRWWGFDRTVAFEWVDGEGCF